MDTGLIMNGDFMRVSDLKAILNGLPENMLVIIPVVDSDNVNKIIGFRKVRTAGILTDNGAPEDERNVLCLNGATRGQDIADQVFLSGRGVGVKEVLYGESGHSHANSGLMN